MTPSPSSIPEFVENDLVEDAPAESETKDSYVEPAPKSQDIAPTEVTEIAPAEETTMMESPVLAEEPENLLKND